MWGIYVFRVCLRPLYVSAVSFSTTDCADRMSSDVVGGPEPEPMHRHEPQYRHEPGGGAVLPRFSRVTAATEYLIHEDE